MRMWYNKNFKFLVGLPLVVIISYVEALFPYTAIDIIKGKLRNQVSGLFLAIIKTESKRHCYKCKFNLNISIDLLLLLKPFTLFGVGFYLNIRYLIYVVNQIGIVFLFTNNFKINIFN